MKNTLTIILPSINPETWPKVYESACHSVGRYDLDFVAVGPHTFPSYFNNLSNFRYIRSFASPAVALQLGIDLAYGKWTTWTSDDCEYYGGALEEALDYFIAEKAVGMVARYLEGEPHESDEVVSARMSLDYWKCGSHAGTNVYGTNPDWWNAPVGLYETDTIRRYGGLDCVNYHHVNMQNILLSHDLQRMQNKVVPSPSNLMRASFNPNNHFIWDCFKIDGESFKRHSQEHHDYKIVGIPEKFGWRNAEAVWSKRWGIV